jgi:hypothetical protein
MTAVSKTWVVLSDAATDADSPVDQALVQGIRDDIVNLDERLGGVSYPTGRTLQNHNHDGVNSALVEIGPNLLRNGSFESNGDGWTISTYTGGSSGFNTANHIDGAKALALTSTSTSNGGGQAINGQFITVTGGEAIELDLAIKASVANVSSRVEAIWYDNAQGQISTTTMYDVVNTPTANTRLQIGAAAPSNARFCKVRVTGGVPGVGSATGTVYFDGLRLCKGPVAEPGSYVSSPSVSGSTYSTSLVLVAEIVAPRSGVFTTVLSIDGLGWSATGRVYKNGAALGTTRGNGTYSENLSFQRGDLIQLYVAQQSGASNGATWSLRIQELRPLGMAASTKPF